MGKRRPLPWVGAPSVSLLNAPAPPAGAFFSRFNLAAGGAIFEKAAMVT